MGIQWVPNPRNSEFWNSANSAPGQENEDMDGMESGDDFRVGLDHRLISSL